MTHNNIRKIATIITVVLVSAIIGSVIFVWIFTSDNGINVSPTTPVTVTTHTTSTPESTAPKNVGDMLLNCTEIGNGEGWTISKRNIDNINGTAHASYHKDNRYIDITVEILENEATARKLYYKYHERNGYIEYSPLEFAGKTVGELSLVCIQGAFGDGYFTTDNIVVSVIIVDQGYLSARDVSKYARQVERKM